MSALLCLLGFEAGFRVFRGAKELVRRTPRLHVALDSPALYGLNPAHPEISRQRLRDDEVRVPKPSDRFRILVLGDSVTYGTGVSRDRAFPHQLEIALRERLPRVEVLNAGVSGYTAYNELQYYLSDGWRLEPDLVVIAFCMNDVANPRLHWGHMRRAVRAIPADAIPNADYDRQLASAGLSGFLRSHSALYAELEPHVAGLRRGLARRRSELPTYITGEDRLSIEVLVDPESAEWRWLRATYDRLRDAVEANGSELVLAILPLAYQIDAAYPHRPQVHFADYCRERAILCIDLLDALGRYAVEQTFLLDTGEYYDIWHLSERGHRVVANAIGDALLDDARILERAGSLSRLE